MTEPIKQEIINNIFENGDKLITGPILQTVLIDMIDDVNVKDQEILSKTGSWDDAVTQIPNLATKAEVTNLSESVARDLTGYATEQWVQNQGYLTEHQDISGLATKTELTTAENNLQGNITSLSESVARDLANVDVDLTGYATEQWVESKGYLTEHQDISNLATKSELTSVSESIQTDISNLATKTELNDTKNNLQGNITSLSESVARDLTGYATETWVQNQGYLTEHQDISNLATKTELTSVSESVQTDITNLSESVANSAVWKKGTGQDSVVQILTGDNEAKTPTATGLSAVATGGNTKASGWWSHAEGHGTNASGNTSHAEGQNTKASGDSSHAEGGRANASGSYSHAEGSWTQAIGQASHAEGKETVASGSWSHAEGHGTLTSNDYEHAQGRYNYTSSNQIFSIGTGNSAHSRRNAVSVLEVDNSGSYTSSFFVQNVGGYDGTNPTPGTNDLATVLNNLPSGGGSSETLWKKGTGTDSIVQTIADGTNLPNAAGNRAIATGYSTKATGEGSHAEGYFTTAEGDYSHAEGSGSNASGIASHTEGRKTEALTWYSHAEGWGTTTSGMYGHAEGNYTKAGGESSHAEGRETKALGNSSHAEGWSTIASNEYEHAQGMYNCTSSNQIFSIGAGEYANGFITRRNAVSVLVVPNADTKINTASFFVQNVGGYDGTNPEPGTNDLATVINGMSTGGGSSETLWKKGTGQDSVVQKVTSISLTEPIASGVGAMAIGDKTKASGWSSHAEGGWTEAKGNRSHAEGYRTTASIEGSHAEGYFTIASNPYEHAQGRFNHNSENQIFSVGAGDGDPSNPETATRRNAISVLAVPNSETQINTASVFIQNIGGYDGTNPTPGTNDLATVINNLSSSGGSSSGGSSETLWKKGEGKDSLVQVTDENLPPYTTTGERAIATGYRTKATGRGSHAEGYFTEASEWYSHAEGYSTKALGDYGHAEGYYTNASGRWSHAEGNYTSASNDCEHAQGQYNCTSSNQIFSVGAGDMINYNITRRNAISVLAVPNSETQVVTASFFVQNVGGYDGTNPTPGTNDLATVLNNTETWTFTLEDGSTVTKTIRIA